MPLYEREEKLLSAFMENENISLNELSKKLFISLPTLRRDLVKLEAKGKIIRTHGGAKLVKKYADEKIPFYFRQDEHYDKKILLTKKAVSFVSEGNTIMLDGSTSAYALIPLLAEIPKITVITSSAKSSLLLGQMGINNICTGGIMITKSFSYIGADAERTIRAYNADILFFSIRGVSPSGMLTDNSQEENSLRRVMMHQANKSICLCDSSKIGKTYLNNLCHISEIDEFICDNELPPELLEKVLKKKNN